METDNGHSYSSTFDEFYESIMVEVCDTKVEYNPILYSDRAEQSFTVNDKEYKVIAVFIPDFRGIENTLHVEFKNVPKNTYKITNDCTSPGEVFGIVLNWVVDHVKMTSEQIDNIVILTGNQNDERRFGKQSLLYKKLAEKFTKLNSDFVRNLKFEKMLTTNNNSYAIFIVSRKISPTQ
jgi:hypothetical protein